MGLNAQANLPPIYDDRPIPRQDRGDSPHKFDPFNDGKRGDKQTLPFPPTPGISDPKQFRKSNVVSTIDAPHSTKDLRATGTSDVARDGSHPRRLMEANRGTITLEDGNPTEQAGRKERETLERAFRNVETVVRGKVKRVLTFNEYGFPLEETEIVKRRERVYPRPRSHSKFARPITTIDFDSETSERGKEVEAEPKNLRLKAIREGRQLKEAGRNESMTYKQEPWEQKEVSAYLNGQKKSRKLSEQSMSLSTETDHLKSLITAAEEASEMARKIREALDAVPTKSVRSERRLARRIDGLGLVKQPGNGNGNGNGSHEVGPDLGELWEPDQDEALAIAARDAGLLDSELPGEQYMTI